MLGGSHWPFKNHINFSWTCLPFYKEGTAEFKTVVVSEGPTSDCILFLVAQGQGLLLGAALSLLTQHWPHCQSWASIVEHTTRAATQVTNHPVPHPSTHTPGCLAAGHVKQEVPAREGIRVAGGGAALDGDRKGPGECVGSLPLENTTPKCSSIKQNQGQVHLLNCKERERTTWEIKNKATKTSNL